MKYSVMLTLAALIAEPASAGWPNILATRGYREDFPSWGALFGDEDGQYSGYEWYVYSVNTQDDDGNDEWELNYFMIRASADRRDDERSGRDDDYVDLNGVNLLMMHGMGQDAQTWLTGYFVGKPLPLKLADSGYTVLMGNNRGTKFSRNLQVSDAASEEYWDFDFTDYALKDLPALVHSISEDFGSVTYVGYDMGNMQLFYGLTQLEDFFFSYHVSRLVALAPSVIPAKDYFGTLTYNESVGAYRALGIYAVNGPNWADDLEKISTNLGEAAHSQA